jgi:hypothetical protein
VHQFDQPVTVSFNLYWVRTIVEKPFRHQQHFTRRDRCNPTRGASGETQSASTLRFVEIAGQWIKHCKWVTSDCTACISSSPLRSVDRALRKEWAMNDLWLIGIGVVQAILLLFLRRFIRFARVMRAKMHSRHGPPLMQNYRDITKLMTRQEVVSNQAGWIFRVMPYLSMGTMFLAAMIIPVITTASPLEAAGDLILIVYLFALPPRLLRSRGAGNGIHLRRHRRST